MKKAVYILVCIFLLQVSHYAFGIEPDESGLKAGGDLRVPVIVLSLKEAEADVGLDEGLVPRHRHSGCRICLPCEGRFSSESYL